MLCTALLPTSPSKEAITFQKVLLGKLDIHMLNRELQMSHSLQTGNIFKWTKDLSIRTKLSTPRKENIRKKTSVKLDLTVIFLVGRWEQAAKAKIRFSTVFILCVWVFGLQADLWTSCKPGAHEIREMVSDTTELEVQAVVSYPAGARKRTAYLCRSSKCCQTPTSLLNLPPR